MFSRSHLRINESKLHSDTELMDEFKTLLSNYGYTLDDLNKEYYYEFRLTSDKYHQQGTNSLCLINVGPVKFGAPCKNTLEFEKCCCEINVDISELDNHM